MDFSERVFALLSKYKERPALWGGKSLEKLEAYLAGYTEAYSELTGEVFIFRALFQEFIEKRYRPLDGEYHHHHWVTILMQHFPGEKAFDIFFEELEIFKEEVGVGPSSLLYGNRRTETGLRSTGDGLREPG